MDTRHLLALQMATNLVSWSLVARWFVWPRVRDRTREEALVPLVAMHWLRTLGLFALVPEVSGAHAAASTWAHHVAIGDMVTVVLAMITVGLLRARHRAAVACTWMFNVWGAGDCAHAAMNAAREEILAHGLAAHAFVVTFGVPALVVSHALVFVVLLRKR